MSSTSNMCTPAYMSPEVCNGKAYDEKSDMWALGCLLYELVTLKRPFHASNMGALVMKITGGIFTQPSSCRAEGIREIISLLLNVQPSKRPSAGMILQHSLLQTRLMQFLKTSSAEYSEKHSAAISVKETTEARSLTYHDQGSSLLDELMPTVKFHPQKNTSSLGTMKIQDYKNRKKKLTSARAEQSRRTKTVSSNHEPGHGITKTRIVGHGKLKDQSGDGREALKSTELPRHRQKQYDEKQRLKTDSTVFMEKQKHISRIKNAKPKICVKDIQRLKRESKVAKASNESAAKKENRHMERSKSADEGFLAAGQAKPRIRTHKVRRNDWEVEIYASLPSKIPPSAPSIGDSDVDGCHFLDVSTVYVPAPAGESCHSFSSCAGSAMNATIFTIHHTPER